MYLPLPFKRLKISLFALIFLAAVLYSDPSVFTLEIIAAAIIHEAGHLTALKKCGAEIYAVEILPFGAVIRSDSSLLPYRKEAFCALAGILFNLVSGTAAIAVFGILQDSFSLFFAVSSYFLAATNLIPVPTHDGARALDAILGEYLDFESRKSIMDTVYYVSFIVLVLASLYVLRITQGNFSLVIFLCFVFINIYALKDYNAI